MAQWIKVDGAIINLDKVVNVEWYPPTDYSDGGLNIQASVSDSHEGLVDLIYRSNTDSAKRAWQWFHAQAASTGLDFDMHAELFGNESADND